MICGERAVELPRTRRRRRPDRGGAAGARHRPRRPGRHPRQQPAGMARGVFRRGRARRGRGAVQHLVETGRTGLSARRFGGRGADRGRPFGGQDFAAAARSPKRLRAANGAATSALLVVMLGGDLRPGWIGYDEFRAAAPPRHHCSGRRAPAPADDALILYTSGSSARPKAVRLQHFAVIENGFNIGERMGLVARTTGCCWRRRCSGPTAPATPCRRRCRTARRWCCRSGSSRRMDRPGRAASLHRGLHAAEHHRRGVAASGVPPRAGGEPADRADDRLARGGAHRRRRTRRGADLQHLRLDRDLRQLLRHPVRLAARRGAWRGRGRRCPGCGCASSTRERRALAAGRDRRARSRRLRDPGLLRRQRRAQRRRLYRGRLFPHRRSRLCRRGRAASISSRAAPTSSSAPASTSRRPRSRACCCSIPAVAQAAVVGAAAGERGEAIVAFVVPKPAAEIDGEELRAHCRALASSYKVPDHIEIRAALPVTETGKLFRRALRDEAEAADAGRMTDRHSSVVDHERATGSGLHSARAGRRACIAPHSWSAQIDERLQGGRRRARPMPIADLRTRAAVRKMTWSREYGRNGGGSTAHNPANLASSAGPAVSLSNLSCPQLDRQGRREIAVATHSLIASASAGLADRQGQSQYKLAAFLSHHAVSSRDEQTEVSRKAACHISRLLHRASVE